VHIACFDLEGVLVPEIWVGLAERTGIDALRATTRDIPNYDELMELRLGLLREHGLSLRDLQDVAGQMAPLDGARDFLDWVRARCQVAILSDTFYELAGPLMAQLGHPMLMCHHLDIADDGAMTGYTLRQKDPKRHAVEAFQQLNFEVIAVGDSYNDTTMLAQAETGVLFRPPENVIREFPSFPVCRDYEELKPIFTDALAGRPASETRVGMTG
jgi:phosphoserine/homoserine phosphotransferase